MGDGVLMAILRWIKKRKITVLLFVFTFIVSGLIINLLQLFTLPFYWLNKKWFRHINARLVYFHWCGKFLMWANKLTCLSTCCSHYICDAIIYLDVCQCIVDG